VMMMMRIMMRRTATGRRATKMPSQSRCVLLCVQNEHARRLQSLP